MPRRPNKKLTPSELARLRTATYRRVQDEVTQGHPQRQHLYEEIEKEYEHKRAVVSFFTSFQFPVVMEDKDADIIEEMLQNTNLVNKELLLIINSPGGDALTAERIVNICRSYSHGGRFSVIVPKMAKSAATMVCFGAYEIGMGSTSELGPIDPQIATFDQEGNLVNYLAAHEIIESYEKLMRQANRTKGRMEPYLEQLARYDAREIRRIQSAQQLSESVAVSCLRTGCFKGLTDMRIKSKIKPFLSPKYTKVHGRPIYHDVAKRCGLNVKQHELKGSLWRSVWNLYVRLNHVLSTTSAKVVESSADSYSMMVGYGRV